MKSVILLFFFPILLFGQPDSVQMKSIFIKTSPFTILDFYNGPLINLSCEFDISKTYSLHSEIGVHVPAFDFIYDWENIRGFQLIEELRFRIGEQKEKTVNYLGLELGFGWQKYRRADIFEYPGSAQDTKIIWYNSERIYTGFVLNIGTEKRWQNGLFTELYFGLGFRLNNVGVTLSEFDVEHRYFGDWTVPHNWIQKEGFNIIPKFNFGLRIGLRVRS